MKYFRNDHMKGGIGKIPNSVLREDVLTGVIEI